MSAHPRHGSPDSPYLTAEEAARYLRRHNVKAFYRSVVEERIPHRRDGRRFLFLKSELDQWLAGERQPKPTLVAGRLR